MEQDIDGRKLVREETKWYAFSTLAEKPVGFFAVLAGLAVLVFRGRRQRGEK